jgi:hypothetical protein
MLGPMKYLIMLAVCGFWLAAIWGIVWAIRKIRK